MTEAGTRPTKRRVSAGLIKTDGTVSRRFVSLKALCQRGAVRFTDALQIVKDREIQWHGDWSEPFIRKTDARLIAKDMREAALQRRREMKALRASPGVEGNALQHVDVDFVYFIRCCEFVKVGYAYNVPARLKHMRVGNPFPLEVLAVLPGDRTLEGALHRRFRSQHHQGDWFRLEGPLQAFISEIVSQSPGQVPWVAPPRASRFRGADEILFLNQTLSESDEEPIGS
jgi:hypothetical protein